MKSPQPSHTPETHPTHAPATLTPETCKEMSRRELWSATQEHVWRAESLAHVLTEMFWGMEESAGLSKDVVFYFAEPNHLRIVAELLSDHLVQASEGLGELEPELDVEDCR